MKKRYKDPTKDLPSGEVNIIPIVDVSFVLVIFCMTTMNLMLTAGINVLETKGGAASGKVALKENITVTLTRENKIFVDSREIAANNLFRELAIALPKTKDKMVIISADQESKCEQVVDILDISKKSGASRLALVQTRENVEKLKER